MPAPIALISDLSGGHNSRQGPLTPP